jgi:hypothetical protein
MELAARQGNFSSWLIDASNEDGEQLGDMGQLGLRIYQDNYRTQLIAALETAYPKLRAWMGESLFLRAAIWHLERNPPEAWTLDAQLDDFSLTLFELFPDHPELEELAWIELALDNAFVPPDAWPITPVNLNRISWNTAHLRLAPSLQTAYATTNAADIWLAMNAGRIPPAGRVLASGGGVLLWRRGHMSCLRRVDLLEAEAIRFAQDFGSFPGLCSMLSERLGERAGVERAASMLASWISNELLILLDYPDDLN